MKNQYFDVESQTDAVLDIKQDNRQFLFHHIFSEKAKKCGHLEFSERSTEGVKKGP